MLETFSHIGGNSFRWRNKFQVYDEMIYIINTRKLIWGQEAWIREYLRRADFYVQEAARWRKLAEQRAGERRFRGLNDLILMDWQPYLDWDNDADRKLEESRKTILEIIWAREFATDSAAHSDSNWNGILLVY